MKMLLGRALVVVAVVVVCSGYGGNQDSCLRFGGGSCCPLLTPLDVDIQETVAAQPVYIVILPRTAELSSIDNACQTFFPLPDDPDTYLTYTSLVYTNGFNEIQTNILSQPETGVIRFGKATCQFTDTTFAQLACNQDVYLNQRCNYFGDCPAFNLQDSPSGVYGFSLVRQPISRACLSSAEAAVSNNGLPQDDYYILPMRLPSRCVLNQVCSVATSLQRFCQTVGVAFPAVNRCAY